LVVGRHAMIDEGDGPAQARRAGAEIVEAVECDNRRAYRAGGAHAPPEPEERHGPSDRLNDPRSLRAADPVRDLHRLEMHVVPAVVAHLAGPKMPRARAVWAPLPAAPREPLVDRRRAGDPVPDPVGELGQALPRD